MKKNPKAESFKPKETALQKRIFELHAQADSRSDEEQAARIFMQSATPKPWLLKKKQRR